MTHETLTKTADLDTTEKNKLIAQFMGKDSQNPTHEYHMSWHMIMAVVAKIHETGYSGGVLYSLRDAIMSADIDLTYNAIVEYIEWYNTKTATTTAIAALDKKKSELSKQKDELILIHKRLYSNMDITSPKCEKEKALDREISILFSQINEIILEKRKLTS